jgi:hypothetical protein
MAMEVLTQVRHIKMGGRFDVAPFFGPRDRQGAAGPISYVSPDLAASTRDRQSLMPRAIDGCRLSPGGGQA